MPPDSGNLDDISAKLIAVSSAIRDLVNVSLGSGGGAGEGGVAAGYLAVYGLEVVILVVTLVAIVPLIRRRSSRDRDAEAVQDAREQAEFEEKMSMLTSREKSVIRQFLEYLQMHCMPQLQELR